MAVTSYTSSVHSGNLPSGGNLWQNIFKSGAAQGDWTYFSEGRAKPQEWQNLLSKTLNSTKRKDVVDYLFNTGAAKGVRDYWYTNRGDEDMDLALSLGGERPAAKSSTPSAPQSRLEVLRQERLDSALRAIRAESAYAEGDYRSQMEALANLYKTGTKEVERNTRLGSRDVTNSYADRGLGTSGLRAQGMAEFLARMAEQQADLDARLSPEDSAQGPGTEVRDLLSALKLLGQQTAGREAEAKLQAEIDELELEQLRALTEAGLT